MSYVTSKFRYAGVQCAKDISSYTKKGSAMLKGSL